MKRKRHSYHNYNFIAHKIASMRDGFRCHYCSTQLIPPDLPAEDQRAYKALGARQGTVDHQTPLTRGGHDNMANMVLACRECNDAKGDMTGDEFRAWLKTQQTTGGNKP